MTDFPMPLVPCSLPDTCYCTGRESCKAIPCDGCGDPRCVGDCDPDDDAGYWSDATGTWVVTETALTDRGLL